MKKGMIVVLSAACGAVISAAWVSKVMQKKIDGAKELAYKHLDLFLMLNQWVKVKQKGKNLSEYFEKRGYKRIAVYGMNYAGETLIEELKNTHTTIAYGIDKNADRLYLDVDVVPVDGRLEPVDAVVITAVTYFEEIERLLHERMSVPVLSLRNILYDI